MSKLLDHDALYLMPWHQRSFGPLYTVIDEWRTGASFHELISGQPWRIFDEHEMRLEGYKRIVFLSRMGVEIAKHEL